MKHWKVKYTNEAKLHIEEAVDYYNTRRKGLGKKFYLSIRAADAKLKINPKFQIKYESIRCLPVEKFPFMLHFDIDEQHKIVFVYAVICTLKNPDDNWLYE